MNTIQENFLVSQYAEYLAVSPDLRIIKTSLGIRQFVDCNNKVMPGKDIRLSFPELVGVEDDLIDVLEGRQKSFELKGIARKEAHSPLYIDLYITSSEGELIVLLDDATERIMLQQRLVQDTYKTNLLLQNSTAARNYIDKVLMSISDALFVTTQSGNILIVNQAALDLFEYSQEELINRKISDIIADKNLFPSDPQQNFRSQGEFLKNYSVVCQTKTGKDLTVAFSGSVMETEIKGLQNFVYVGRDITQIKRSEQLQSVEHSTTRILANSATLFDATTEILSTICLSLGWELGELWSVDEQANVLRRSSSWHKPGVNFPEFEFVSQQMTFSPGVGLPGRVWASGQPAWINDVVHDANFLRSSSALAENLHAAFGFPIKCGSEITGVIIFFSHKILTAQSDLLAMMAVIGSQIGQFMLRLSVEAALRSSEERFHSAFDYASIGMALIALDGRWLQVNRSLCEIVGYKSQELLTKTSHEITYADDREADTGHIRQLLDGEVGYVHIEKRYLHKTGDIVWVLVSVSLVRDAFGQPLHFISQIQDITERKQALNALKESEERFRSMADSAPILLWITDADGLFTYVNQPWLRFTGRTLKQELGFGWTSGVPADDWERCVLLFQQAFAARESIEMEHRLRHHTGEYRWMLVSGTPRYTGSEFVGYIGSCVDITQRKMINMTERKLLEQELFEEKELALVTLQSIGDAVITTNASGQIKYLNPVAEQLTGWNLQDAQGHPLAEVFRVVNETTGETVENPVEKALLSGCFVSHAKDSVLITRSGAEIAIDDSAAPIRAKSGQIIGAVMVFQDVSTKRSMARQLSWQATHDPLTGLFNRSEFEYRLEQALNSAKTQNQQHALCYLDLDRFKIVNDTCGHAAGDELLRQVTTLLQADVRSSDTLARLGGDEFAILLEGCPLESALRIANMVLQRIQEFRFVWQDKAFNIGVSIGLVVINADSQSSNSILSAADAACYAAKNKGRNRVHIYQADDRELAQATSQIQWVVQINQALEENRFCLYYQTIVPTCANQPREEHYEVLLRLIDDRGNVVSPMAFIPAAERYNLMQAIDRWVIRTLFAHLGRHRRDKWTDCTTLESNFGCVYAINLSGASINDDQFLDFLREQLILHQIPPQVICFEITETVAIANLGKAASLIRSLKDLGCCFALDDFGSGMSSFGYLKNLPVDYLKIDGSFVKNIVSEPIDLAMVEAINQIGHVMGIQTIAEFVENKDILEKIKAIGVDYAQGYGIAKPRPLCFKS